MAEKSCSSAASCSKESCEGCPSANQPQSFLEELNIYSEIKHVIGVVSGKGGVGKSMVTASLANLLAAQGYRVGIMDADITGPSIPRMYGLDGPAMADDQGMYPVLTKNDIKVMSINLLMPDPEAPVIWRGPVLAGVVKQFWTDVTLTVFQSIPVDGIVIVTSPQDLVKLIVKKAYNMAATMKIPVLGMIENYSYLKCPDCGKEIAVFGESKIDAVAGELGSLVLGKLPIDPEVARLADAGAFDEVKNPHLEKAVQVLDTR